MAPLCSIIPEYLLNDIVEKGVAPEHVVNACRSTIEKDQAPKPPSHLKRTIYDAGNSFDYPPPRDSVVIKEGGALISKERDPTKDANECYNGLEKAYDFFSDFFHRDSIDNKGMTLDGIVHYGNLFNNAMWTGEELVFGTGDGTLFDGFTDELDIIAHEFTHGVIDYTSPLNYTFQSGALNESIADVFGIMIKQWAENPERPQTVDQANWLIGDGIWATGINGRALRDMKHPGTAFKDPSIEEDQQPSHWRDFKKLSISMDNGGVHINSGIPNRAFYLAARMIGGYSWEGAGPIWYKAITSGQLGENATFKEFADITIQNAGEHRDKVKEAWRLVGYLFPG